MNEKEVNKIIDVYDEVIADLKQENQQLKHILDELEKWLENRIEDLDNGMYCLDVLFQRNDELLIIKDTIEKTLDKIKELRGRENE